MHLCFSDLVARRERARKRRISQSHFPPTFNKRNVLCLCIKWAIHRMVSCMYQYRVSLPIPDTDTYVVRSTLAFPYPSDTDTNPGLGIGTTPAVNSWPTHRGGRRCRPGWRWAHPGSGWRAGYRPRRCTTWRSRCGRSCTRAPSWWSCWSGPAARRPRWRRAGRRRSAPAWPTLRGGSGPTPCCLIGGSGGRRRG